MSLRSISNTSLPSFNKISLWQGTNNTNNTNSSKNSPLLHKITNGVPITTMGIENTDLEIGVIRKYISTNPGSYVDHFDQSEVDWTILREIDSGSDTVIQTPSFTSSNLSIAISENHKKTPPLGNRKERGSSQLLIRKKNLSIIVEEKYPENKTVL
jgi:hypothetical protein